MNMNVEIVNPDGLPMDYIEAEIDQCEKVRNRSVRKAEFRDNGDGTSTQRFWFQPVGFERIRRITGYLVGDLNRFNNAKAQEVRDRVKHTVICGSSAEIKSNLPPASSTCCESTEGR